MNLKITQKPDGGYVARASAHTSGKGGSAVWSVLACGETKTQSMLALRVAMKSMEESLLVGRASIFAAEWAEPEEVTP